MKYLAICFLSLAALNARTAPSVSAEVNESIFTPVRATTSSGRQRVGPRACRVLAAALIALQLRRRQKSLRMPRPLIEMNDTRRVAAFTRSHGAVHGRFTGGVCRQEPAAAHHSRHHVVDLHGGGGCAAARRIFPDRRTHVSRCTRRARCRAHQRPRREAAARRGCCWKSSRAGSRWWRSSPPSSISPGSRTRSTTRLLITWFVLTPPVLFVGQWAARQWLTHSLRGRRPQRAVIVGATELGARLEAALRSDSLLRTDIVGYFDDLPSVASDGEHQRTAARRHLGPRRLRHAQPDRPGVHHAADEPRRAHRRHAGGAARFHRVHLLRARHLRVQSHPGALRHPGWRARGRGA